jgi:hypothetical protein
VSESRFQQGLIRELREMFAGSVILKNDPEHLQGVPDILILFENMWAALECKDHPTARRQPNQRYYVELLNGMSYAAFIYPENKDEILHELQLAFRPRRSARVSQRQ